MIASVSVFESYQITQKLVADGVREFPSNSFYLWRSFMHTLIGLIEPAMIVLLGLGVGTLLASVLMPIYNLTSAI